MTSRQIIFFILALLGAGGAIYILTDQPGSGLEPARFLPADTIAFFDVRNPVQRYRSFTHSTMGRQVHAVRWSEVLGFLDYPEEKISKAAGQMAAFRELADSRLFREIIGRRAVVAVLPSPGASGMNDAAFNWRDSLVLITRPRHRAALLEFFSSPFVRDFQDSSRTYLGREIRSVVLNEELTVHTAVSGGYFLAAFSPDRIMDCLNLSMRYMTEGKSGLSVNPEFVSLHRRTRSRDDQFLYLEMNGLRDLLGDASGGDRPAASGSASRIERLPLRSLAVYRRPGFPGSKKMHYQGIMRYDQEAMETDRNCSRLPDPVTNSLIREVPADLLAFFWTNMLGVGRDCVNILADAAPERKKALAGLEQWLRIKTGHSLDSFFSLFGGQFSINVSEVRKGGFLPIPKLCCRIEVRDRSGVERMLHDLVQGLAVQSFRVNGTAVASVQLAGGLIQPSFALQGRFLIVADSREQIEHVLDGSRDLLYRDSIYRKVDVGLAEPNNMAAFVRHAEFIETVKGFTLWTGMLLSMSDHRLGEKSRIMINQILLPLLEGLKMYRAGSSRVFSSAGEIIMETVLLADADQNI